MRATILKFHMVQAMPHIELFSMINRAIAGPHGPIGHTVRDPSFRCIFTTEIGLFFGHRFGRIQRPSNAPHDARTHARMLPHDVRMHARMLPRILPTCCRARRQDHDQEIEAKGLAVREALSRPQGRQVNSRARSQAQEVKTAK
jgi:hypothetical protein